MNRVEEASRTGQMLDHLSCKHHIERATEIRSLRVGRDHIETAITRFGRKCFVQLDADGLRGDRRNLRMHPVRAPDTRPGADVEHTPVLDMAANPTEAVTMRPRRPIRLQEVTFAHEPMLLTA